MKNHADGESPEISERLRFFVCGVLTLSFGGSPLSLWVEMCQAEKLSIQEFGSVLQENLCGWEIYFPFFCIYNLICTFKDI